MFTHVATAVGVVIIMSIASGLDVTATQAGWWFFGTPLAVAWGIAMSSFLD